MAADHPSRFAAWRGGRPFWGGLLVTLGGGEIILTEWAPLGIVLHLGLMGLAGYLLPALIFVCGVLIIYNPTQRLFYGVVSCLLTLGTWITSNLGGFVIGMLLGIVGSALTVGWMPEQEPRRKLFRRGGKPPGPDFDSAIEGTIRRS